MLQVASGPVPVPTSLITGKYPAGSNSITMLPMLLVPSLMPARKTSSARFAGLASVRVIVTDALPSPSVITSSAAGKDDKSAAETTVFSVEYVKASSPSRLKRTMWLAFAEVPV